MRVATGPNASTSWQCCAFSGLSLRSSCGPKNASSTTSPPTNSSGWAYTLSASDFNTSNLARTSCFCSLCTKAPMRTPSSCGSPMTAFDSACVSASWTLSIWPLGTNTRRTAVHFCPDFTVISLRTSFMNSSNSGSPGTTCSPRTAEFNESASMLNGTAWARRFGCERNFNPVEAEPVNVTTSRSST